MVTRHLIFDTKVEIKENTHSQITGKEASMKESNKSKALRSSNVYRASTETRPTS